MGGTSWDKSAGCDFLGSDPRSVDDIIREDGLRLARLGLTTPSVGDRLTFLTESAREGMGKPVDLGPVTIEAVETMGWLACPFRHSGFYPKAVIKLTFKETGETLTWSSLSAHLARDHGFFGGEGSPFRLEPEKLAALMPTD